MLTTLAFLASATLGAACGGGAAPAAKPDAAAAKPATESAEGPKAEGPKAEGPKADAPRAEAAKADPKVAPWSDVTVREAMAAGSKLIYARTGTNAKGKKVEDTVTFLLRSNTDQGAGTSYTIEPDPGSNAASSQVATMGWTKLSPFFAMEKPTVEISGRESVTVPAGTFEASVAQIADFFGNAKTVYMVVDKPGIYAKVVEKANTAADPKDKTDLVYELKAIEAP